MADAPPTNMKASILDATKSRMISIVLNKFERRLKRTADVVLEQLLAEHPLVAKDDELFTHQPHLLVLFRIIRCAVAGLLPPWLERALPAGEREDWHVDDYAALQSMLPAADTIDLVSKWLKTEGKTWRD